MPCIFLRPYGTLLKFYRSPLEDQEWENRYLHHLVFGDWITLWIQLNANILKAEYDGWNTNRNYLHVNLKKWTFFPKPEIVA